MARTFSLVSLSFIIFISVAKADFLGLGDSDKKSRVLPLIEKFDSLQMKVGPAFEEEFNMMVKNLEHGVEEEKLYCSGELADADGKMLPQESKKICMRELKNHYLSAMEKVFELKKKYMDMVHAHQQEKMLEIHKKLKSEIEKKF